MNRLLITLVCLLLAACSAPGPSNADIRAAFEQELPGLVRLQDFELANRRNVGSDENPVWMERITARVAVREATYDIDTVLDGKRILKPVRSPGDRFPVYATVRASRSGGRWEYRFIEDASSKPVVGHPRSDFGPDALIAGSPEAMALEARIAQEKERARIEEETRLAAEAAERKENEQAETAKRQRIEAAVAKYHAGFAPASMWDYVNKGQTRVVLVTAKRESSTRSGAVYGTDHYGSHSDFPRSVIHAGLLKDGETGVVEVTGIDEWRRSVGSPRNGIDSMNTDRRNVGYTMRLLERIGEN